MAQVGFGADTDFAGFADTARNTNGAQYALTSSSTSPTATEAQATDSLGDVAASTQHDTITTRVSNYVKLTDATMVFFDTLTSVDFRPGKVVSSYVIQSIAIGTSPDGRPTVSITQESCPTTNSLVRKIPADLIEISGARKATALGFATDTVTKLNSSSITLTGDLVRDRDSQGNTAVLDIKGGRVEASHDIVGVTGLASGAADTGWTLQVGIGGTNDNAGYNTRSATVFQNLASTAT